ncbi:MAG: uracil phosphoribosyltransferase [Candidatus Wallbacteria bacterium HGW-Wallbacteria-1]|uniref:Uracil phosphoribosyltransferase n=1 Tax=Candidatus Wallbacteria bacterium HGW-Wallbacteria-1 TaxID=2013854 RepID=A0A2N1PLC5_9BACT|nr:MAG: uracil phosphoribosyltransferase [Candidatus Wallbacteria bacterium HGW-Wallbacteria-1]
MTDRTATKWPGVFLPRHAYMEHKLSVMRSSLTPKKIFKELVEEISLLLTYEATADFPLEEVEVETPLETAVCRKVKGRKPAVIPILRAGLGMLEGVLKVVPQAKVGHIGVYRDHETKLPVEYFCKLPTHMEERECIVLDPMLATGGSASFAIQRIKERGAGKIKFLSILSCPEGIERLISDHPDITIFTAAIDRCLNEKAYILPGLGDAGDRLFGTF